jgi:hypothetical protein
LQYLRALSLDQQNARAMIGLAIMKLSRSENDGAMAYLRDAIAAKPDSAKAYYWLGVVFQNEGRYAQAADAYEKFLSFKVTGYPENVLTERLPQELELLKSLGMTAPFAVTAPAAFSMPFELSAGVPVVAINVNGIAMKLLIDSTNHDFVFLDASVASKAKIPNVVDIAGKNSEHHVSFLGKADSLRLGEMGVANVPVYVMDHALLEQRFDRKLVNVDGVIGLAWLRTSVVTFDYGNSNVKIATPSFADALQRLIAPSVIGTAPNVIIKLPFQLIRGKIIVTGSVADDPVSWMLSTADTGMTVSSDYAAEHFKPDQLTKNGEVDAVKNLVLNFGGLDISNPNVEISKKLDDSVSKQTGLQFAGILGHQFLRNLTRMSIDFANMTVTFAISQTKK